MQYSFTLNLVSKFEENVCLEGTWGPGCQVDCHCSVQCDRVTGHCPGDCEDGWFGDMCQTPCHCSVQCDKVTGHCPGTCEAGWIGKDCQQGHTNYHATQKYLC